MMCTCTSTHNVHIPESTLHSDWKVGKLSSVGVKAVRAVSSNKDVYSSVLSGEYRFGIGYIRSHMHAAYTHACTLNTCACMLQCPLVQMYL